MHPLSHVLHGDLAGINQHPRGQFSGSEAAPNGG
jgi:hypothetical protein